LRTDEQRLRTHESFGALYVGYERRGSDSLQRRDDGENEKLDAPSVINRKVFIRARG
jgi:hypothetical protein